MCFNMHLNMMCMGCAGFYIALGSLALTTIYILLHVYHPKKRPPGPRPWPVIGNLLHTSPIPHEKMLELNKRYGPLVFLKLGQVPAVCTDDPDVVKNILKNQDGVFASRPANIASQHFTFGGKDIAFAPYGPHWRVMRKLCTVELLSPRRLELPSFRWGRDEEVQLMLRSIYDQWKVSVRESEVNMAVHECEMKFMSDVKGISEEVKDIFKNDIKSSPEVIIRLRDKFGCLASNNLSRMLTGKRFFGPGETSYRDAEDHKEMIYDAFALVNAFNVADYLPFLRWFDLQGHERKMKQIMKKANALYDSVIEEHRRKRECQTDCPSADDKFVDVLLKQEGLSHTVIKAILIDMAAAGTDTTAITSEWTMAEIVRNPSVLSKVRDELHTVIGGQHRLVQESDLKHLKYLRAVVKEVLRLHPVGAFLIPHVCTQETELNGYTISKGTRVLINTYALGRNPSVWENPLEFRPERFLHEDLDTLFDSQYRMVPFGAGRRGCPGAALGTCVILFGVASLIHSFDWSVPNGGQVDTRLAHNSVILEKPLELVATPRLEEHLYYKDDS